ncbi:MAG TPA: hypothetical protein VFP72_03095 [Kineosporiaceae bacterium]|nr:hypothetical protein [Kineosporiaceae bacterium]
MAEGVPPIRLAYATTQDGRTLVRVRVKDLAGDKRVGIRGRIGEDWQEHELSPASRHFGYDVFADTVPRPEEFAVFYHAGGASFWDNNDGRNYRVPLWANAVGGRVCLRRAELRAVSTARRRMHGLIYVDNVSYRKSVGVRMLPDGASRWIEFSGLYDGIAREGGGAPWVTGPAERWSFTSPPFDARGCRFAVYYRNLDSAQTYWDNNFGQDYLFGNDLTLD